MAVDFTAELELAQHERAELADTCSTPGFRIIQKIFEAEIQKFFVALINIESGTEKVIEGQRVAKTAAQLWEGGVARINFEIHQHRENTRASKPEAPIDPIAGMIDMGPEPSTQIAFEEELSIE